MRCTRPFTLLFALLPLAHFACATDDAARTEPPPDAADTTSAEPAEPVETAAPAADRPAPEDVEVPSAVEAMVAAEDRTDADRALDEGRRPAQLLAFLGLEPGDRVADLGAGGGYTTELLARAVGPEGVVYGQNSPWLLERFAAEPWAARLERPVNANVKRQDRPFDAPFDDDVRDLDAVVMVLFYHDTFWQEVDRAAMNAAIFDALKPGGVFLVVDHSARAGAGDREVKTLHRVEESLVRQELERAGFVLKKEGHFLRNPDDDLTWSASPGAAAERRGTSDRFVLLFEKPAG